MMRNSTYAHDKLQTAERHQEGRLPCFRNGWARRLTVAKKISRDDGNNRLKTIKSIMRREAKELRLSV